MHGWTNNILTIGHSNLIYHFKKIDHKHVELTSIENIEGRDPMAHLMSYSDLPDEVCGILGEEGVKLVDANGMVYP